VSPDLIAGDVDEGYGKVADVFSRNMTRGQEVGVGTIRVRWCRPEFREGIAGAIIVYVHCPVGGNRRAESGVGGGFGAGAGID
jgi:hypothetical protein